jgi:hypothetical protein
LRLRLYQNINKRPLLLYRLLRLPQLYGEAVYPRIELYRGPRGVRCLRLRLRRRLAGQYHHNGNGNPNRFPYSFHIHTLLP